MGGNNLSVTSVRLNREEYERVTAEVVRKLRAEFPKTRIQDIKAYREKQSFGDLDILVESTTRYHPIDAYLAIDGVEYHKNGPCTSIGIETPKGMFQVDLIESSPESFDYASNYFAWNDLGNLNGRIAHKMGCSHGHDGLWYYCRDGDNLFHKILLTRNHTDALHFMGISSARFKEGFDTLEDIYKFVQSFMFFNEDIYLLDNRNHISRIRDKKRATYMGFLEYCRNNPTNNAFQFPKDKTVWHERIQAFFPHFDSEYAMAWETVVRARKVREKFNGEIVMTITGLKGKELGSFMSKFRESADDDWIISATPEDIERKIDKQMRRTIQILML